MKLFTLLTSFVVLQLQLLHWLVLGADSNQAQFTLLTQFKCDGVPMCAISQPSKSFSVVSKAQCVLYCQKHHQQPESCSSVNYKEQSNTCQVFNSAVYQFKKNVTSCQYIQNGLADPLNCLHIPARDCDDVWYLTGTTQSVSGVYTVFVGNDQRPLSVYCEMTSTGGWTVFQRRQDGSVDFYRNWTQYAAGFGDLNGEFWIGNDNLNLLTSAKRCKLRVDLADFDGNTRYAEYDNFMVNAAADNYRLASVGTYTGTAGNSLPGHVGCQFSTYDSSNAGPGCNAAVAYKGAWWYWYINCGHRANLNGHFYGGPMTTYADGVIWYDWHGHYYSLKSMMKIKSVN